MRTLIFSMKSGNQIRVQDAKWGMEDISRAIGSDDLLRTRLFDDNVIIVASQIEFVSTEYPKEYG